MQNPKLFRELSEPFESAEKANEALNAFFDELGELRKKHRIRDLHMIVAGSSLDTSGEEGGWLSTMHYGDSSSAEAMCAYAYGVASTERQEHIQKLYSGKGRVKLENR